MKRRNFIHYSYFNKVLLNACGLLPVKSPNHIVNFVLVFASLASSCFVFGPGLYSLIFHWNYITPSGRFDIVNDGNVFVICAIKVCILFSKREQLFRLMENCANLWKYVESDEDSAIVHEYAKRGLYLTYFFAGYCFFGNVSWLVTPLFVSFVLDANGTVLMSKKLPYSAGIFHENVNHFYVWHALQVPMVNESILAIVAIDTAISFYVLHACAHMKLCQTFFRRVNNDITLEKALTINDAEWNTRRKKIFEHVVKCVSYHKKVLQYSRDVEEIFASVILVQMLQCLTAICGFSCVILVGDKTERPRTAVSAFCVVLQLLLLCWPSDDLKEESLEVANAAYDLPWYDWRTKEGRLICVIIANSQKPVTITARKFLIISLETFTSVLKTAFSMATLLRQFL